MKMKFLIYYFEMKWYGPQWIAFTDMTELSCWFYETEGNLCMTIIISFLYDSNMASVMSCANVLFIVFMNSCLHGSVQYFPRLIWCCRTSLLWISRQQHPHPVIKTLFFPIGYQAPYSGEWPSSLSPGQQNYSDHSSAVNHAQSITSQAMNNSFGPVPTNTSPKRSPLAHGHGKKKKQWMLLLFAQYWCCIVEQGSS